MKRKLPGRGSSIGACGRTLSLLSSDPCHAALPRTLRASRAPGTDPARNGCSSAPPQPPRLQRRLRLQGASLLPPPPPGGLWSSLQAELQVREPEASVPRVSGCRKLEELLLPPADSRGCSCHSALPRRGKSGRRCSPPPDPGGAASPFHGESRASREPHHCAAPGAGPGGPACGAPEASL